MRSLISVMMGPSSRSFFMASHQESGQGEKKQQGLGGAAEDLTAGLWGRVWKPVCCNWSNWNAGFRLYKSTARVFHTGRAQHAGKVEQKPEG